jgi:5-methylcytosine-specific restriction endonuclease McrA
MSANQRRQPVSKRARFEVFKRDNFTCQYCGAHPPDVLLHADHIVAVANGGGGGLDNLITACQSCNLGKGAVPLNSTPETMAQKAARVAEAEEQLAGYSAVLRAKRERIEEDAWEVVHALTGGDSIHRAQFQSIKTFINRLPTPEVVEAAEIARAAKPFHESVRFKYFCGVCWSKIRESVS